MKLAINGGQPIRNKSFPAYRVIDEQEKSAVNRVLDSGILSRYLGCWHEDFFGGPEVQALEKEWAEYFKVKHAIAVNSCTSGLHCAVGATGVEPGEEIIVAPYTMTASATAPLVFNAVPIFADIEEEYFCLDPNSVEKRITPKTKAIIVVDLFGLPYDADAINALAKKHGLYVIEDAAQAPGATYNGKFTGTLADMGVYSLNYHKHIHCGEGGIVVTDNDELADRIRLIRNHAEAVVEEKGVSDLTNMLGFNFRMPEMEAAIARCQIRKLSKLLEKRLDNCQYLEKRLAQFSFINVPKVRNNCTHSYYVHACKFNEEIVGITRDRFIEAVRAELPPFELRETEGVKISCGYVKPLYLQPLFQKMIAYGSSGFPFRFPGDHDNNIYSKGICPMAEKMHHKKIFIHEFMQPQKSAEDMDDVVMAFDKVWKNIKELK